MHCHITRSRGEAEQRKRSMNPLLIAGPLLFAQDELLRLAGRCSGQTLDELDELPALKMRQPLASEGNDLVDSRLCTGFEDDECLGRFAPAIADLRPPCASFPQRRARCAPETSAGRVSSHKQEVRSTGLSTTTVGSGVGTRVHGLPLQVDTSSQPDRRRLHRLHHRNSAPYGCVM
jgi:hypothetical protein